MNRRRWLFSSAGSLAAVLSTLWFGAPALSQEEEPRGVATLKDQLKFGVKARRPVEFDFIDLVVSKVEQKLLPRDMALSAMTYAQSKNKDRPYPYFEFSLKKRAAAIGVQL